MSEQEKDQEIDQSIEESTPELTDVEVRALDMGWKPKDQFQGSEDEFISAAEFVRRQPLFDKIEQQSRQLKTITRALNELKEHHTKVNEAAYNRALADLKLQRKEALTSGDGDKFEQLDDEIKSVEQQKADLDRMNVRVVEEPVMHPEFQTWKARNGWYDTVGYMRKYADEVGTQYHQQGLAPADVLREVEKAVRKEFPQKFTNVNKESAPHLDRPRGSGSKSSKTPTVELTETERKIMKDLVRGGHITEEKYLADLALVKGQQ